MRQCSTASLLRLLAIRLVSLLFQSCNHCRFAYSHDWPPGGWAGTVDCCSGSASKLIEITASTELEARLFNVAFPGQSASVDAFFTEAGCEKLFDGSYPKSETGVQATPLCRVLAGPIGIGSVGARQRLAAGQYRLFAQAWSSNNAPARFSIALALWVRSCVGTMAPTFPEP